MHDLDLILTLTAGLTAALVLGYITHRLSLSPIVGYLLAGIAVGPATPGFIANKHLADQMAEIGVILLMFGVGLHFHVKDLLAVRKVAIPGALGQAFVATILGCVVGLCFGWPWHVGIVFGLAISVASTVVMLRVLADNNELHTPTGRIAVGWLVVEDLFAVLVLVLLPVLFQGKETTPTEMSVALASSLAKIVLLVIFVFVVGGRVIPWFLAKAARTRSRELFTLSVLVVALGIAVGATRLFGVSPALGAFLAGMAVGQSEFSSRAVSEALPMRDAFAVLFFVSVGMLFDPFYLLQSPLLVLATLAIIIVGSPLTAFGIVLALRYPLRAALSLRHRGRPDRRVLVYPRDAGTQLGNPLRECRQCRRRGGSGVDQRQSSLLFRLVGFADRAQALAPFFGLVRWTRFCGTGKGRRFRRGIR